MAGTSPDDISALTASFRDYLGSGDMSCNGASAPGYLAWRGMAGPRSAKRATLQVAVQGAADGAGFAGMWWQRFGAGMLGARAFTVASAISWRSARARRVSRDPGLHGP